MIKNIAIIGANGATGKKVINAALKQGYAVTAVVRDINKIKPQKNLNAVTGDVTNADSLIHAFSGMDAVISCFGPANNFKAGNLMSVGTKSIIHACKKTGIKKLVFMSGILQSDGKELSVFNRLGQKLIRLFYYKVYSDKKIAENAIIESNLNWTIVRAVGLNDNEATGKYRAGANLNVSPFKTLPHSDCAVCLVEAITKDSWNKTIINVGK
jgi:putative NADH-flavin reductase